MEMLPRSRWRSNDLQLAIVVFVVLYLAAMVWSFLLGFLGKDGCEGECRTYVDAGVEVMGYGSHAVLLVVAGLVAWAWTRKRMVSVWPIAAIPVLAVLGVVGFLLAGHGDDLAREEVNRSGCTHFRSEPPDPVTGVVTVFCAP